jgi:uncharacterized protein (TIGR00255 family)
MTGFGSASTTADGMALGLELRSVNSRHLKLNFRIPPGTERWEETLREVIAAHVRRGHIDVTMRVGRAAGDEVANGGEPGLRLDAARVEAYVQALRELQATWNLPGEIDLALIGRCDRLLVESATDPADVVSEQALREVAEAASIQLVDMRRREGDRLAEDLMGRLAAMEKGLEEVERLAPARMEREADRLRSSIRELAGGLEIEPDRLAREIAFIADKWDISEEIVRIRAHLEAFRELLDAPSEEPVGKRLGFLGQELLREVNTIGSKANDATIGRVVVDMKNELESLREQNENVE